MTGGDTVAFFLLLKMVGYFTNLTSKHVYLNIYIYIYVHMFTGDLKWEALAIGYDQEGNLA